MTNFFKAAPDIRKTPRRMKRVSAKRRIVGVHRAKFVAEQLAAHPRCQFPERAVRYVHPDFPGLLDMLAGCTGAATEIHEPMTRARKPGNETILDADNSLAGCHQCHAWTHAHPALAEQMGLLKSSRGK